jgi:hypothetical protein
MEKETYNPFKSEFLFLDNKAGAVDNPFVMITPTKLFVINGNEVVYEKELPEEYTFEKGVSLRMAGNANVKVY